MTELPSRGRPRSRESPGCVVGPALPRPSCAAFLFLLLLPFLLHQGGGHEPASRKSSIEFPLKRKLFIRFNLFIQPMFSRTALGEK